MRWVDELLTDEVPKWARDTVQESLNARDVEIAKQYDEIKSLRAEVAALRGLLEEIYECSDFDFLERPLRQKIREVVKGDKP